MIRQIRQASGERCPTRIKMLSLYTSLLMTNFHLLHRTRVHHPLSSPEVSRRDSGLLYPVLCEGRRCAVDHESKWDEVSKAFDKCS